MLVLGPFIESNSKATWSKPLVDTPENVGIQPDWTDLTFPARKPSQIETSFSLGTLGRPCAISISFHTHGWVNKLNSCKQLSVHFYDCWRRSASTFQHVVWVFTTKSSCKNQPPINAIHFKTHSASAPFKVADKKGANINNMNAGHFDYTKTSLSSEVGWGCVEITTKKLLTQSWIFLENFWTPICVGFRMCSGMANVYNMKPSSNSYQPKRDLDHSSIEFMSCL